jgi:hypothetical protein
VFEESKREQLIFVASRVEQLTENLGALDIVPSSRPM